MTGCRLRTLLPAALLAAGLGACDQARLPTVASTAPAAAASTLSRPTGPPGPPAVPARQLESPLARYLGFGHDLAAEEAQSRRDDAARDEVVAACMRREGFDYDPEAEDDERLAGLSRAEQRRFRVALSGIEGEEEIPAAEMARYDRNRDGHLERTERYAMGCLGAAEREVPGVYLAAKILRRELDAMEEAVRADAGSQDAATLHLVRVRHEARFVDEHRSVLERYARPAREAS